MISYRESHSVDIHVAGSIAQIDYPDGEASAETPAYACHGLRSQSLAIGAGWVSKMVAAVSSGRRNPITRSHESLVAR
jgi:hypothetical protein